MGRLRYSKSERKAIIASLVMVTKDLIAEQGIESVSIRKVAARAGYSSATIYLYFDNIDELIVLSCIDYLEDCYRQLSQKDNTVNNADDKEATEGDLFFSNLTVLCNITFANPKVFMRLFFNRHSLPINDLIKVYYSVFSESLDNLSWHDLSMMLAGNLSERGLQALYPFASEQGFNKDEIGIINNLLLSYYKSCLEELSIINSNELDDKTKDDNINLFTQNVIDAARFLLQRAHV